MQDTLRVMVAVVDTVRDTVIRVAAPNERIHDSFDWFQLWLATIAAIVAAFIGAIVGGWQSREAMSENLRAEVAANREERRAIVKRRIKYCLTHAIAISENIDNYAPEKTSQWLLWTSALFTCELFERVSDEVVVLKDSEYQERVEVFFHNMRTTAREMIAQEERLTQAVQTFVVSDPASNVRLNMIEAQLAKYRAQAQEDVKAWELEARRLLNGLEAQ